MVVALAALPYVNGLGSGFTFDDVPLAAENPRIRSMAGVGRAFTTDWWDGRRPHSLAYRPLMMASFAIDYAVARAGEVGSPPARLAPAAARPFHIQNVAWHAAASLALFFLVLELFARPGLALATAALFAVHPVHTEAVDGIVGRAELMSACFSFLALLAAWRVVRDDPPGAGRPALAGIALFLALLSKEQAMVIPAVSLLWLLPLERPDRAALIARRSVRRLAAAFAAALVAYLVMRAAVLGSPFATGMVQGSRLNVDNPVASAAGAARFLTPVRVFGHALRVLVFPRTLSADYSYDQIPIVSSLDAATACCALAIACLVAAGFLLRRRAPAAAFGIGLFLLSWALTSNLAVVIGTIFGERLLYLPSAGICLAVASALVAAERSLPVRWLSASLVAALVLVSGARTFARNRDWLDNETLFAATASASPRSCKALDGNGSEWLRAGRPEDAIVWAERSLAVNPSYAAAHQTLSKSLRAVANAESDPDRKATLRAQAGEHARTAIAILGAGDAGALGDAWNTLGGLALDQGNADDALLSYRKSLEYDPSYVPAVTGLGAALAEQARSATDPNAKRQGREAALKQFEQALALDPGNADAQQDAAVTMRALADSVADDGKRAELLAGASGHEANAMAAQRERGDAAALANLHGLSGTRLLGERRLPEALAEFREAARLQPTAARGFVGVGTVLATQAEGELDAARKAALLDASVGSFEHAIEVEPGDPEAHLNLGIVTLRRRGDPKVVAEQFRTYLRLVPDTPQRAQMEQTIRQMETAAAIRR